MRTPPHLDLVVVAAEVMQDTLGVLENHISRPIKPSPGRTQNLEPLPRQFRIPTIAPGDRIAANPQLPLDPGSHGLLLFIEDARCDVGGCKADWGRDLGGGRDGRAPRSSRCPVAQTVVSVGP